MTQVEATTADARQDVEEPAAATLAVRAYDAVGAAEVAAGADPHAAVRDAFVRQHAHGSFFHLTGWGEVIARVHGHERRDLLAWRGSELVGVLPLMLCRGLRGRNLYSMPYAVYGGPIGVDDEVERALVHEAGELGRRERVGRVELRYLRDTGDDLPVSDLYWTFLKDLPDDPEGVLKGMPKKARAEARKARKRHGLELIEGEWYVDDLARLFLQNKHTLGSPALPPEHFHVLLEDLPRDEVFVHLVRRDREPMAAVMSFAFEGTLIAYYAGTKPGADRSCSASNFMYMALQEWAVERGFKRFDFCRSRGDSGAFQFKKHQGFEPTPLHYRYLLVRDSGLPTFTPSNPKTRILRAGWSKTPLWLAQRLSRRLARYLP